MFINHPQNVPKMLFPVFTTKISSIANHCPIEAVQLPKIIQRDYKTLAPKATKEIRAGFSAFWRSIAVLCVLACADWGLFFTFAENAGDTDLS